MEKHVLQVDRGIKYISDWKNYFLPKGHVIVDKGVTGCGYTEYCLRNRDNVVLCSPRKLLLENKRDQHKDDINILYLENGIKDFQGVKNLDQVISNHIFRCQDENEPIKFMVTYDSLHYLVDYLTKEGLLDLFYFVIDEFQVIFLDSYFKSDVELDFVDTLQYCPNVIYLSATPMLERYLDRLPEFKDLPYQVLDWSKTGYVEKAVVYRKRTNSLAYECGKIIDSYLSGDFKILLNNKGIPVPSKEAIFYLNSVSEIVRIVKSRGLTPENTRIICADTPENRAKLKKLSTELELTKEFEVGKVPLENEENPMFMFCTSTVYVGVDFYSDNARTFVFADPNILSLGTDISMDLPQIAGRLRNRENPYKNEIAIFYKTQKKPVTKEEFDKLQEERKRETEVLLNEFSNMSEDGKKSYLKKLRDGIQLRQYSDDFVSVSEKSNLPVYNYLVEVSNERAWEVSQKDYQDNISVTKALEDQGFQVDQYQSGEDLIVQDFLDNHFYQTGIFTEKMKMYCEFRDQYQDQPEILKSLNAKILDQKFRMYYEYYGTSGCRASGYREIDLYRGWKNVSKEDQLREAIYQAFLVSGKYALPDIKETLGKIYKALGISKTPKATDLQDYFEVSKVKIPLPDKTRVNGFEIKLKKI